MSANSSGAVCDANTTEALAGVFISGEQWPNHARIQEFPSRSSGPNDRRKALTTVCAINTQLIYRGFNGLFKRKLYFSRLQMCLTFSKGGAWGWGVQPFPGDPCLPNHTHTPGSAHANFEGNLGEQRSE